MRFGDKPIPENIMELIPKAQRIIDENPNSSLPLKAKIIQNKQVLVDKEMNSKIFHHIISDEKWRVPFFKNVI